MFHRRGRTKVLVYFLLSAIVALTVVACNTVNLSPRKESLFAISPLPTAQLPNWIEQISPVGEAQPLNQIRIRFKEDLIPVEILDSPEQQKLLDKFSVLPPLPGRFRFLTPRMVGFQGDRALPKATRIQVTLKAGLGDLKGNRLDRDFAWTFNTQKIVLSNLPGKPITANVQNQNQSEDTVDLQPTLNFTSNVELDLASVQEHLKFYSEDKTKAIAFKVELEKNQEAPASENPQEKFDPSARQWIYKITPQQTLEKAKRYRLEFSPGLRAAQGNLASELPIISEIETYSPLAFKEIQSYGQPGEGGGYARFINGDPELKFNNGIVAATAIESITIDPPPPANVKLVRASDGDQTVSLNAYALKPNTDYTINIGTNLKDQFGQILPQPVRIKYHTGDLKPDIWIPEGLNIFPTGKNLQLNISTVNLPENKYLAGYRIIQPTDLVYRAAADPQGEGKDLLPKPETWQSFGVKSEKNQVTDIAVPIREKLGGATGMLAYGVQAKTFTYQEKGQQVWQEPTLYGLVQLTNLGVFSQWFPESGIVRVNHLADGSPVVNAAVEVYESKLEDKSTATPVACASGKTDGTGTLLFNRQDLQKCINSPTGKFAEGPKLLTIAREDKDWAFARSLDYSGAYGYGFDGGWNGATPESRGVIFSDRQLYQPGEKAWLTGFAYYLQNGKLVQDKNASYQVTLEAPDGQKTNLGDRPTNEFGTFSLELPIQKNQKLGYYALRAKGKNGVEIAGEFRVAEFKPPNFKVALELDREYVQAGDRITAKVVSNYLFGAPVEGGKVKYYVTRKLTTFIPKGREQFSFGRQWFWPEESPTVTTDVLELSRELDREGKSSEIIEIAKDLPYPMIYRTDAQVTDVSNLSVANSKEVVALVSDRLIGLQSNFVVDAGKPLAVQLIVTDPTGKALEGQPVRLELQKMKYSSVTRVVEGSRNPQNQIEYQTVAQVETTSNGNFQTVNLTPPESGSYRIQANFTNAKNDLAATDLQIWATGKTQINWGHRWKNNRLEVKLDKPSYKPGEIATALIQSPYPEAELYFAVVRHNTLYQTLTKVKGGAPQIKFTVTPEMLPNAAVEAVLVRQGKPLEQVEPGTLDNLVRIGFAPFQTNLDDKYLKVQITPVQGQLEPGANQTVQLELKTAQNQPVKGQLTVMVVNEAVLQLSGYRPPDLVKTIYAEQLISTRFADNRPDVILQQQSSPLQKGWGYGGGNSKGVASTRLRTNFQPLAYYNGAVITDANGKATVNFKLPDDLTTWRIMVVATATSSSSPVSLKQGENSASENWSFGSGDATFIASKPLLSNPILPQFVRPGDRFEAGLAVTNNTGQKGNLTINGLVSDGLQFTSNNPERLQTQIEPGTHAYRFPVLAGNPGEGKVQFYAQLNGVADAFAVPLAVKDLDVSEQVVTTGTTANTAKIPLKIDNQVDPKQGGLEINLASTLITEITAPAKEVLAETELPFLEPAASQLAIATNLQILGQKFGQVFPDFNPSKQALQALEQLQKLQKPDGGFASWPGQEKSDPFLTPYSAISLAKSDRTFPKLVPPEMRSRLKTYLQKLLANPGQADYCKEQLCKNQLRLESLTALAELGDKRSDFLADIYAQRDKFDLVTQIKLARYLSQIPDWKTKSQTLFNQLQQNISESGRAATLNIPTGWGWLNSPAAAQAEALRMAIAQSASLEMRNRLLSSLLALRRNGTWQNSYNNAAALTALVEYSQLQSEPPNFTAIVQLAGKKLAENRFLGYRPASAEIKIPMTELPKGNNELTLQKSGEGTLHYLVAYKYRLPGNQPGRFNGLRVTREIRPANQSTPLKRWGMSASEEPFTVAAGQVFDIGLEIITDQPVERAIIKDPLPAGFEAVDTSFQTSTSALQAQADSWQISYQTIYKDKVVAYSDRLEPGVYSLHYLVRSVTPGTFFWPGAEVHLQYAPEEFGRSASATLKVAP